MKRLAVLAVCLAGIHAQWPLAPGIVVQGIVIGSLTALMAAGIALVHRTERIVNLAQGDLGALPATLAVLLIVGPGWPIPLAAAVGLVAAIVLGVGVERLIVRRFARAPRLLLTAATIGLAQVLAAAGLGLPSLFDLSIPPTSYPAPFELRLTIDPITFTGNDVVAVVVVVLALASLAWLLGRTGLGLALRAVAHSSDRAALVGIPGDRVRMLVWVLATVLASIAVFLRAGIVGLPIGTVLGPTVLVQALAAAVIGRMERLSTILLASIGLGIFEAAILFRGNPARVPILTFVVVAAALIVQHRGVSRRHHPLGWRGVAPVRPVPEALRHLPLVRRTTAGLVLGGGSCAVALPAVLGDGDLHRATGVLVLSIVAVSLVVLTGWAGQVSLGQVGFMGVGAAIGGAATARWGWDLGAALLVAGVAGAVVALVVGIPALRLPGPQLAVTSLAFSVAVATWLLDPDVHDWLPTGRVARTPLFGRVVVESEPRFYYLCLAVLMVVLAMTVSLRRSRTGRALLAVREDEQAAAAAGVDVVRAKLTAFAVSGFLAALAGALLVHHQQVLSPSAFPPELSLQVFTTVVLGGLGSFAGAIVGSAYVQAVAWTRTWWPEALEPVVPLLGSGAGMLVVLLFLPGGIGSALGRLRDAALRRVARDHGLEVIGLTGASADDERTAPSKPTVGEDRGSPPLLHLAGIHAGYDGARVLVEVDLAVAPGEVVALLGTNGAGKSTVLRVAAGLLPATTGAVELAGADLATRRPHERVRDGLVTALGGEGTFADLTVAEHLRLAARHGPVDATAACATFPELLDRLDDRAGDLSGGLQHQLTLTMAFLARPRVLLIDELTLGLSPVMAERAVGAVRDLAASGVGVVVVEQAVDVALAVADRAVFMDHGRVQFSGPAQELAGRQDLLRAVFLPEPGSVPPPPPQSAPRVQPVLELAGLRRSFGGLQAVDDVSLTVRPGEIVGLIGPNGAGKTTLFDLVSGFVGPERGTVSLGGRDVTVLGPAARARAGLGRSFQDARLFPALTVAETIAVALDREVEVRDPVALALRVGAAAESEERVATRVEEVLAATGLTAYRDAFVSELSTGVRHLVDLAGLLGARPSVILLDEPSAGLARHEAEAMVAVLRQLRDETGAALLVIEHDLALVADLADRLVALDRGRVVASGPPREVLDHPAVLHAYLGPVEREPEPVG